jgi:PleD family two-component response regulator
VILYADGSEDTHRANAWKRLSEVCTVRQARSSDELLDLTTFFLHRPLANLPDNQRKRLTELHQTANTLSGRRVLIVDDDIRNIFALSTILEDHEMVIVSADNGRDAIRTVRGFGYQWGAPGHGEPETGR